MPTGAENNGRGGTEESTGADPAEPMERGPATGEAVAARPGRAGRPPLTEQQKRILGVAIVVHALVVLVTLRDLRRRPAAAVRGPKWVWGMAATLNTSGSVAYWLVGRRRPGAEA